MWTKVTLGHSQTIHNINNCKKTTFIWSCSHIGERRNNSYGNEDTILVFYWAIRSWSGVESSLHYHTRGTLLAASFACQWWYAKELWLVLPGLAGPTKTISNGTAFTSMHAYINVNIFLYTNARIHVFMDLYIYACT